MMILRASVPSPYSRKVILTAKAVGLGDALTIEAADTNDDADTLRTQNPLGKIPTLITEDGKAIYDSRVICEYLNTRGTHDLFGAGAARLDALILQALADGMVDAAITQVYEKRFRPEEKWHAPWLDYQNAKIERAIAQLETAPPASDAAVTVGTIALCCALGYLDFRLQGAWRGNAPQLAAWFDRYGPSLKGFDETRPDSA